MPQDHSGVISPSPHVMAAYIRNAKAIGVLWAIFTICYAIVAVLIFLQPYWLGSTDRSDQAGVFGLYQYCSYLRSADVSVETCQGDVIGNFQKILSPFFKAATILVGVSAIFTLLCIACMVLFICVQPKLVFSVCAGLQFLSFICILAGCIVYPAGWDNTTVQSVCGSKATKYNKGVCELRWSYILAIVGVFDSLFLAVLGFVLAAKQIKPPTSTNTRLAFAPLPVQIQPTPVQIRGLSSASTAIMTSQYGQNKTNGSAAMGNNGLSQFSTATLKSSNRAVAEYASAVQNFQL